MSFYFRLQCDICCPTKCCNADNCNRCCCCFDSVYHLLDRVVGTKYTPAGTKSDDKSNSTLIYEWMRSFNCWPLPYTTIILISVQLYFFISMHDSDVPYNRALIESPLMWRSNKKNEIYRWFTYSFLHANHRHIISNMIMQIFICVTVELEHKWIRCMIIYVVGVCCGSLFHSLASCHALVGASGGVYALIGAGIIKINRYQKYHGLRRMMHIVLSVVLIIFAFTDTVYTSVKWAQCKTNVAVFAHIGGLLSGKLLNQVPLYTVWVSCSICLQHSKG